MRCEVSLDNSALQRQPVQSSKIVFKPVTRIACISAVKIIEREIKCQTGKSKSSKFLAIHSYLLNEAPVLLYRS